MSIALGEPGAPWRLTMRSVSSPPKITGPCDRSNVLLAVAACGSEPKDLITTPPRRLAMNEARESAGKARRKRSGNRPEIPGAEPMLPLSETVGGARAVSLRLAGRGEDVEVAGCSSLVDQLDRVAFANHSFSEDGAIDPGHAFMRLRDGFQYRRRFFRSIGVQRDHHATGIALKNCDGHFCADAQRATDEFILGETVGRR